MKKGFCTFLSAVMVLSLAGCGSTSTSSSSAPASPATTNQSSSLSASDDVTEYSIGHVGANSPEHFLQVFCLKFKEEVEKNSDGKIIINIHPAGELGGDRDMIEGAQFGTIDFGLITSGALGNFVPEAYVFDFPFLFKDRAHTIRVLESEIGQQMTEKVRAIGVEPVVWADNGFRVIVNSKHPIKNASDLKGIKIRTVENKLHMAMFQAMGADPTPIGAPELYTSLQQGVVDAMEGPPSWVIPNKFYEVCPYYSVTNHLWAPSVLISNKDWFNGLPQETQEIFRNAANIAAQTQRDYLEKSETDFAERAKELGCEVVEAKDIDRESFIAACQPVYDQYEADFNGMVQKIRDLA